MTLTLDRLKSRSERKKSTKKVASVFHQTPAFLGPLGPASVAWEPHDARTCFEIESL